MPGVKGRSGRKPEPEVKSIRAVLDEHISPAQWEKILAAPGTAAAGNIPAPRQPLRRSERLPVHPAAHDHETPLDRDNHGADALRYWAWMRARRT